MVIRTFESSVPTKPLNDAQMRGAFCLYTLTHCRINGLKASKPIVQGNTLGLNGIMVCALQGQKLHYFYRLLHL